MILNVCPTHVGNYYKEVIFRGSTYSSKKNGSA